MEASRVDGAGVPDEGTVKKLLDWRPDLGVVSVYVAIDHGDRSEGWRVELRDRLDDVIEAETDHHGRRALTATAERIKAHFPDEVPSGRGHIGFCAVKEQKPDDRRGQSDIWMSTQMAPPQAEVVRRERPHLTPLIELLEEGAPVGVVAVSAERVRLHEWALGTLSEIHDWEAVLFIPDWRERKAQSTPDPARVEGASSSGHDQYDQRLEHNRRRFLKETGALVGQEAERRRWRSAIAFGDPDEVARVAEGASKRIEVEPADDANVISEDHRRLLERVERAVDGLNRRRELTLVQGALDAAFAREGRGAVGVIETQRSLEEGRVRHLLFDAEETAREVTEVEDDLVEKAIRTRADVTPVEGDAAELLREHGGVAALLRY